MGRGKTTYPPWQPDSDRTPLPGKPSDPHSEETDAKICPTLYSTLTTARRCRNTAGISAHYFRFPQVLPTPHDQQYPQAQHFCIAQDDALSHGDHHRVLEGSHRTVAVGDSPGQRFFQYRQPGHGIPLRLCQRPAGVPALPGHRLLLRYRRLCGLPLCREFLAGDRGGTAPGRLLRLHQRLGQRPSVRIVACRWP